MPPPPLYHVTFSWIYEYVFNNIYDSFYTEIAGLTHMIWRAFAPLKGYGGHTEKNGCSTMG